MLTGIYRTGGIVASSVSVGALAGASEKKTRTVGCVTIATRFIFTSAGTVR